MSDRQRLMRLAGAVVLVFVAAVIGTFVTIVMTHRPFDHVHLRPVLICVVAIVMLLGAAGQLAFGRDDLRSWKQEPGADDE